MSSGEGMSAFPSSLDPPYGVGERDPAPPVMFGHVEGSAEMPEYESPEEMAASFGAPVHVPTWWPAEANSPKYAVHFPHPESTSQWRDYRISCARPGPPSRLFVVGSYAPNPHEADGAVWVAVPELAEVNGIASDGGLMCDVIVEVGGQTIHLTMFPSVEMAVRTALSLRRVDPPAS